MNFSQKYQPVCFFPSMFALKVAGLVSPFSSGLVSTFSSGLVSTFSSGLSVHGAVPCSHAPGFFGFLGVFRGGFFRCFQCSVSVRQTTTKVCFRRCVSLAAGPGGPWSARDTTDASQQRGKQHCYVSSPSPFHTSSSLFR